LHSGRANNSENLTTFLINLGMAQIKNNLLAEAEKNCREAKKISTKNKLQDEKSEAQHCLDLASKKV